MTSLRTVPLLFLNLGGEMMYILDQRLTAQKIPKDKALKDIWSSFSGRTANYPLQSTELLPRSQGCEVPGCIRTFDWNGEVRQVRRFPSGGNYSGAEEPGSLELHGNRVTKLGSNIYKEYPTIGRASPAPKRRVPEGSHNVAPPEVTYEHADILAVQEELNLGQEELNLLMAQLLGNHVGHERKLIHLNLVNTDREEEDNGQQQHGSCGEIISIDASNQPRSAVLEKVYGEMTIDTVEPANVPEDILEILDSLS